MFLFFASTFTLMLNLLYGRSKPEQQIADSVKLCKFCHVSTQKGFEIIWQDDKFTAFLDHKPSAVHHIQVIPLRHIENVRSLHKADVDLVRTLKDIGNRLLDELDVPSTSRKLGFHIPPCTSVNHLHLHVQGRPYITRKYRYPVVAGGRRRHKGFSWFVEVDQVIGILDQGGSIGILPC